MSGFRLHFRQFSDANSSVQVVETIVVVSSYESPSRPFRCLDSVLKLESRKQELLGKEQVVIKVGRQVILHGQIDSLRKKSHVINYRSVTKSKYKRFNKGD